MLPKEAIEEYKQIYKKEFNVELDDNEAIKRASNLFRLFNAVYGNIPADLSKQKLKRITRTSISPDI